MKNWVAEGIASDVNDFTLYPHTYLKLAICFDTKHQSIVYENYNQINQDSLLN